MGFFCNTQMMPTKRIATQVYQNRNWADETCYDDNMQNYGVPGGYVPHHGGRGRGGGGYEPRRFSLPPSPYNEERRRYYDQNRHGSDTPKTPSNNKQQRRRSRETRSQSRNRKSNNPQTPQQIRNGRRQSMDNHMYPVNQGNRRHGGSRDPSPHVWEMTNTANYQQQSASWRNRDHSPMYRGMTDHYGGASGPYFHDPYRPRSREASPGYYGPHSPVYGPQSPIYGAQSPIYGPGQTDNWRPFSGRRPRSRDPSPQYGEGSGYMYRSLPRRPPSRDPSPHQYTRDKPPRHYQRKSSSRPSSRDPSPNYGDFGYVRTILFDRRPSKEHAQYLQSDIHSISKAIEASRRKGKF